MTRRAMIVGSVLWLVVHPIWTWPLGEAGRAASLGPRSGATVPLAALLVVVAVMGTALVYTFLALGAPRVGPGAATEREEAAAGVASSSCVSAARGSWLQPDTSKTLKSGNADRKARVGRTMHMPYFDSSRAMPTKLRRQSNNRTREPVSLR